MVTIGATGILKLPDSKCVCLPSGLRCLALNEGHLASELCRGNQNHFVNKLGITPMTTGLALTSSPEQHLWPTIMSQQEASLFGLLVMPARTYLASF